VVSRSTIYFDHSGTSSRELNRAWANFRALAPRYLGEQKDFEVYSCHVSPDGSRLATAAGGKASAEMTDEDIVLNPILE
jgi:hypothetical protein